MKLSTFTAQSHLPANLIRAVVRQIGGWESFKDSQPPISLITGRILGFPVLSTIGILASFSVRTGKRSWNP